MRALPVVAIVVAATAASRAAADTVPEVSLAGPAAIRLVIDDAIAAAPADQPRGDATLVARFIADSAWRDAIPGLDEALADTGVTMIDRSSTAVAEIRTIELAGGARATIYATDQGGWITVTPRPIKARARGACIAIPDVAAVIRRRSSGVSQRGEFSTHELDLGLSTARQLDLDGDAVLDAVVPIVEDTTCPHAASWKVYAVRGTCGHLVATVGPGYVTAGTERHAGFLDLKTGTETVGTGDDGIPVLTRLDRTYTYSARRGRYRKAGETRSDGRCHHCSTSSCRRQ